MEHPITASHSLGLGGGGGGGGRTCVGVGGGFTLAPESEPGTRRGGGGFEAFLAMISSIFFHFHKLNKLNIS